jgi:hypothetical protein
MGGAMILGVVLVTICGGCVRHLRMPDVEGDDGQHPHTVILYSGVRDSSRRYADYGAVDATILDEQR